MPDTGTLTRKVGPLPVWAWGAVAVGGFLVLRGMMSRNDGSPAMGVPSDIGSGLAGGGSGGGSGDGGSALTDATQALTEAVAQLTDVIAPVAPSSSPVIPSSPYIAPVVSAPSISFVDPVQEAIAAEYAGTPYNPPTLAAGPYPSPTQALATGPINSPSDLLAWMKQAAAAGIGQIVLPSGEFWATNPATIAQTEANIAAATAASLPSGSASGSLPTISSQITQNAPTIAAPSVAASPVDYSKAIATVQGYIANLSAVKNPTTAQKSSLAMYQARLIDYQSR